MAVHFREANDGRPGWWWISFYFTHPDGRKERIRKPAPQNTRKSAEKREHELRAELQERADKPPELPPPPPETAFDEFVESFLTHSKNNNKPGTVYEKDSIVRLHLRPFFTGRALVSIGVEDLERYKSQKLAEDYEKKTINNHLMALSKLLKLAEEYGKIVKAPRIPLFPRKHFAKNITRDMYFDFDEADRVVAALAQESARDAAMVLVALKAGLRIGEIRALQKDCVDLKAGKLVVRRSFWEDVLQETTKSGKDREIPLTPSLRTALAAARSPSPSPFVFCDANGEPLTYSECRTIIERVERKAAMATNVDWHKLRHTFASHLVMRGVPLKVVQELMGHADIQTTMIYAHLSPAVVRDAIMKLDEGAPV